ncbi:MAG: hypothetical protein ABIJ41_08390 [Candidatus Omnitrophota bacterium]
MKLLKNKSFTLAETLIVAGLVVVIGTAIGVVAQKGIVASLISSKRAEKNSQLVNVTERMVREIELTYKGGAKYTWCGSTDSNILYECDGTVLTFKSPIVDEEGNQYTESGNIRYGAYVGDTGYEACHYEFLVNSENHQLIRRTVCPDSIESVNTCGNGTCEDGISGPDMGEDCNNCTLDCPPCGRDCCGATQGSDPDGNLCDTAMGENCQTCLQDCGTCCGDGVCNFGETCLTCTGDCGPCEELAYCGDGSCNGNEICGSCDDCSPCCGDEICNEDCACSPCPQDCTSPCDHSCGESSGGGS